MGEDERGYNAIVRSSSKQVREFVDRIAKRFRPEKIVLFGSEARGEGGINSDVDLLVVMPDGGDPLGKAIEITRTIPHHGFSLDLIVRDSDVLRQRIDQDDWFLREIMEQGIVLYEATRLVARRENTTIGC